MFLTSESIHALSCSEKDKPDRFTYPFNYKPHICVQKAAQQVQDYLEKNDLNYDFGIDSSTSVGKMFGVLVVEIEPDKFGYLAAFSGKINDINHIPGFVPPIYNSLDPEGFYKKGEEALNALNLTIEKMESSEELKYLMDHLEKVKEIQELRIKAMQAQNKSEKLKRDEERARIMELRDEEIKSNKLEFLRAQSTQQHYTLRKLKTSANQKIRTAEKQLKKYQDRINELKCERKKLSGQLQDQLHKSYTFLNYNGEEASLLEIFEPYHRKPPAGAGECAAPRLLNYAYKNNLKPIAMGEFWWGAPPNSEIRQHKNFYPACKSKCEPILNFMLQGLKVEPNPVLEQPKIQSLDILFEDEHILVVNKPEGLLSVPGKKVKHCLEKQVAEYLDQETTPMLVHRLDMSTSGIVLIAKNMEGYKFLQNQFMDRSVQKTYTALLDGLLTTNSGTIDLPIRVDLDNRPMQLVCYEHGKKSITHYQVVGRNESSNTTRILFYPITGRTHQLRVHAAHQSGLHMPIKGDELYGKREDRLYLHATELQFDHPISRERMHIICPAPF